MSYIEFEGGCAEVWAIACSHNVSFRDTRNEQLFTYVKKTIKYVAQLMGDSDDHCKNCWPQYEFVIVKITLNNTRLDEHYNYHFLFGVDSLSWRCNIR